MLNLKRERVRYEVDPYNRLVIADTGKKTKLPDLDRSLPDALRLINDSLSYLIKAPVPRELGIPHQVRLRPLEPHRRP